MTHPASIIKYEPDSFDLLVDCLTSWFGPAGAGWSAVKLGANGHIRLELPVGDIYVKPGQEVWIKRTSVLVVAK